MDIFNEKTKEIIECGVVFEGIEGGGETAIKMYQEAVRLNVLSFDDGDVMELFYGNSVYEKITSATRAVEAICVAFELNKFYKGIQNIGSLLDNENGWAKAGVSSVAPLKQFFTWLAKKDKAPCINDISVLKSVTKILEGGAKATYKITSSDIQGLDFFNLVERVLSGDISVGRDGDLVWN